MPKKVTHPAKKAVKKPAVKSVRKNPTAERMRHATKPITKPAPPRRKAMTETMPMTTQATHPKPAPAKTAAAAEKEKAVVFEVPEVNMKQKRAELMQQAEDNEAANDEAYAAQVADLKKFADKANS
jgi:cytoskeletal protein RodZ